jgi:beta-glucosidase
LDAEAADILRQGIGPITRVGGSTNLDLAEVAAAVNEIQHFLVNNTRLGIPAIIHEETLHGVLARGATIFQQSTAGRARPSVVRDGRDDPPPDADDRRSAGLAPVLDIARDPRWGRIEETYGEDPYLAAEIGCACIGRSRVPICVPA